MFVVGNEPGLAPVDGRLHRLRQPARHTELDAESSGRRQRHDQVHSVALREARRLGEGNGAAKAGPCHRRGGEPVDVEILSVAEVDEIVVVSNALWARAGAARPAEVSIAFCAAVEIVVRVVKYAPIGRHRGAGTDTVENQFFNPITIPGVTSERDEILRQFEHRPGPTLCFERIVGVLEFPQQLVTREQLFVRAVAAAFKACCARRVSEAPRSCRDRFESGRLR